MTLNRGDIGMARFPHAAGTRGKKRPVLVIRGDAYNQTLEHFIVAEITKNLAAARDPSSLFIDIATPEGKVTGLDQNSVVGCLFLATVARHRITRVIGKLSAAMMQKVNDCLKAAMELP